MSYYDSRDDEAYCPHPDRAFARWLDSAGWLDPFGDQHPDESGRDLWKRYGSWSAATAGTPTHKS